MNKTTPLRRMSGAMLLAGAIAGPLYLTVGLAQAIMRPGFDVARHPLSLLSNGELGWIQTANFWITGVLIIIGGVGLLQSRAKIDGKVTSILIMIYGLSVLAAGFFKADPGAGFPSGSPEMGPVTTIGILHFAAGGIGFLGLIAAALIIGVKALQTGATYWDWFSIVTGVFFFAAFIGIAAGAGHSVTILGFYAAVFVGFAWLTTLFVRARQSSRRNLSAPGVFSHPVR